MEFERFIKIGFEMGKLWTFLIKYGIHLIAILNIQLVFKSSTTA